jgi:hypothetical protein
VPQETYSFVVRVWKEEAATPEHTAKWRGSIDNVLTGERCYIRDLDNISEVIRSELGLISQTALDEEQNEAHAKLT